MLDILYYPVSAILWFWHKAFGFLLDPSSGLAWALSVIFLVFTLRTLLFKPFVHQVRSMRKMQQVAPRIQELRQQYGNDQQKLAAEMQKLQSETGFNPMAGCLPMLVQIPVFFALFRVLRGFRPDAGSNFVFGQDEVRSFVEADLFGAKLSNWISQSPETLSAFDTNRTAMLTVAVPLMIAAAVATHFTARHSVQRQGSAAGKTPQAAVMNRLMMWIFPLSALVAGFVLPLAILVYWLANNFWTLGQQYVVYRKIDREEAESPDSGASTTGSTATSSAAAATVVDSTAVPAEPVRAVSAEERADRAGPVAVDAIEDTANEREAAGLPAESVDSEAAAVEQPGDIPGVTEDRSGDADTPGSR